MKKIVPLLITLALGLHSTSGKGIEVKAHGAAVDVVTENGGTVTLPIEPAPIISVVNEPLKLSVDKPAGYSKGTKLRGCNARDVNASGSLVLGSLEIRVKPNGDVLKEGEDYLVDAEWAGVGIGPKSRVKTTDTVFASYRYSRQRLDTVQVSGDGKASLKVGKPHISAPVPPEADAGQTVVAHVFVSYGTTEVKPENIYPVTETAAQAKTASTTGRTPKTLAKLKAGQPVTIVCLGDSVTAGGNASKPENRYVEVFAAGLRAKFPGAKIDVQNISAGGSNSTQWLDPEKHAYRGLHGAENPAQFDRVVAAKPDLVTIEFVNDAGLNADGVARNYGEIMKRLEPCGAEIILITPHFTMWKMMGFKSMREPEKRPYVLALRDFATQHHLGLADASARWEHLWKEGLPYLSLLDNTINHPDDRGHRLFAEEMWKCFE